MRHIETILTNQERRSINSVGLHENSTSQHCTKAQQAGFARKLRRPAFYHKGILNAIEKSKISGRSALDKIDRGIVAVLMSAKDAFMKGKEAFMNATRASSSAKGASRNAEDAPKKAKDACMSAMDASMSHDLCPMPRTHA